VPIEPGSDKAKKVMGVARRLRVLHSELSDQTPDVRRAHLNEEIDRAVKTLVPAERRGFLESLLETFPTTGVEASDAAAATERAAASSGQVDALRKELIAAQQGLARLEDPAVLVERLIEVAAGLPEERRRAIARRLAAAGLAEVRHAGDAPAQVHAATPTPKAAAPVASPVQSPASMTASAVTGAMPAAAAPVSVHSGAPGTVTPELRKVLGLGDAEAADAARAMELTAVLADFTKTLDDQVWRLWSSSVAAGSKRVTKGVPLQRSFARYVMGDKTMARDALTQEVFKLQKLALGLAWSTIKVGRGFANNWLGQMGVDAVTASSGTASLTTSKEKLNWKKYVELMEGRDQAVIEKEIIDAVREYVESLFPKA